MHVAWKIHDEWLDWMKGEHIPSIMEEGSFDHYQLSKLRNVPEEDGPTYCVQYYSSQELASGSDLHADYDHLLKRISQRWGTDCLAFRTIMEVIH